MCKKIKCNTFFFFYKKKKELHIIVFYYKLTLNQAHCSEALLEKCCNCK
jgi:hypothetical protein